MVAMSALWASDTLQDTTTDPALNRSAPEPSVFEALPCYLVNNLTQSTEEQCKFIIDNDCLDEDGTIDYVYLVYCRMGYEMRYFAIALIASIVIILFLNLSTVADEYLCPSLLSVAKNLRMSDSLAGVTLLAFGNGCPDIFSSLAAASSSRPKLIVGELLGAGIFCTSIVAGLVFISAEFKPAVRPLLRDGSFYLLSVCLIWYFCWQRRITFYGSLAFIIIYVIYLVVALCDQVFQARLSRRYLIAEAQTKCGSRRATVPDFDENSFIWRRGSQGIVAEVNQLQKKQQQTSDKKPADAAAQVALELELIGTHCDCYLSKDEKSAVVAKLRPLTCDDLNNNNNTSKKGQPVMVQGKSTNADTKNGLTLKEWDHFMSQLNPIDCESWNESGLVGKLVQVLRAPLLFITILTVPVVDLEKKNNNWCRLLNSLHCFMIPFAFSMLIDWDPTLMELVSATVNKRNEHSADLTEGAGGEWLQQPDDGGGSSAWLMPTLRCITLLPGTLLALFVFKTTEAFSAPKHHAAYAYFGFAMSVTWIYLLATEIISLLKTVGIMFSMTDTAIGLGVLAWGNSLGDIVANRSLSEAGYPRMALGACIGAPLLNLLLGFGLSFSITLKPGQHLNMDYSPTVSLLCSTLIIILVSIMLSTLIPAAKSRRPFGYMLISGYAVYFLLAVCFECGVFFPNKG